MSLDNVLAVAGAARGHLDVLVIGLLLSVALMGAAANLIARLLERYRWISYIGLAIVVYVAAVDDLAWRATRCIERADLTDFQQQRRSIIALFKPRKFVAAGIAGLDGAQFLAQRRQALVQRRRHQAVGAIGAIVAGQRQEAVGGQQHSCRAPTFTIRRETWAAASTSGLNSQ